MTEEEFLDARDIMAEAVARAKLVLVYIDGKKETMQVNLMEDGTAQVTSWESESDYDWHTLGERTQTFPGHLLFCTDAEVEAWKLEMRRVAEANSAAHEEMARRQKLHHERVLYEALKAKFGKE